MSVAIVDRVGKKVGMTRIFDPESGASVPVSVIEILPNIITDIRTKEIHGYDAIQITTGSQKASRVNKPITGNYKKAGVEIGRGLWEIRLEANEPTFKIGDALTLDQLSAGQMIDVIGTSKGKGFAGAVKRHNFRTQDATHGNSRSHRAPGSIGQNQTPGRVFKGKKMAGHMGCERVTVQNIEVVRVDSERNVLLVKGAIPGFPGADIIIKAAVKFKTKRETTA